MFTLEIRLVPSKSKVLLRDGTASNPNTGLGEQMDGEDKPSNFDGGISPEDRTSDEVRRAYRRVDWDSTHLGCPWRRRDIQLLTKDRVHTARVNSVRYMTQKRGR